MTIFLIVLGSVVGYAFVAAATAGLCLRLRRRFTSFTFMYAVCGDDGYENASGLAWFAILPIIGGYYFGKSVRSVWRVLDGGRRNPFAQVKRWIGGDSPLEAVEDELKKRSIIDTAMEWR